MKIVTYNVNGLRQRVAQHGCLIRLLNSLDADIICFQETKLSRQDLSADLTMAEGYEAFVSCTRTSTKGRTCYSGVATFCRVASAFSSSEVVLPLAAEEGFTGLLKNLRKKVATKKDFLLRGVEDITMEDLLRLDSEGRCIITDHGHFVLFNIYGPRAVDDDKERLHFKFMFFKILQKKWESLLSRGRRVFVVGDLNIAPAAIDCCDAGPDFEENRFRKWLRSLLVESGGPFFDVFRAKHPARKEAYTCWPQNVGGEEFNYGSRIDHILIAGSCLHHNFDAEGHSFLDCHVKECDILTQFKRGKPDNTPRWKGGRSIKLDGSDHVPVYVLLNDVPNLPVHDVPSLAARYVPEVHGRQQTIASLLQKRRVPLGANELGVSNSSGDNTVARNRSSNERLCWAAGESEDTLTMLGTEKSKPEPGMTAKKKARNSDFSQRSIRSFFQQSRTVLSIDVDGSNTDISHNRDDILEVQYDFSNAIKDIDPSSKASMEKNEESSCQLKQPCVHPHDEGQISINMSHSSEQGRDSTVLLEWQRIQQRMQTSLPLCKGHGEPCVKRSVKKAGPNIGRGFYVCARAKGPTSNPEANCGYFQWASVKSKKK